MLLRSRGTGFGRGCLAAGSGCSTPCVNGGLTG